MKRPRGPGLTTYLEHRVRGAVDELIVAQRAWEPRIRGREELDGAVRLLAHVLRLLEADGG